MKVSKTVYLSGPMRGYKEFNFPEFYQKADDLRQLGYNVINPAENFEGRTDLRYEDYMKLDIKQVTECDAIAMLEGWEKSDGARVELMVAQTCGLDVLCAESLLLEKIHKRVEIKLKGSGSDESILLEANRLVNGDRQDAYGEAYHDFSRTAKIWSAILGSDVTPQQVGLCMCGVKISRECNKHKTDNLTDLAGYAQCVENVCNYEYKLKD